MRRLLVALLLALSGVVLGQLPAHACSCVAQTTQAQLKRATDVFAGMVTSQAKASNVITYEVTVERVYKGEVTSPVAVRTAGDPAACGLGSLVADKRYVFMGAVQGEMVEINSCGGTALATTKLNNTVSAALGAGTAPTPTPEPTPPTASITRVDQATPTKFSRLAAPGGALVLVGLFGLFLLRRTARAH
jgi:hypothetical protein